MTTLLALAASTLVSEDLALLAAGGLIAAGRLGAVDGIAACALGIFAGDLMLYAAGRLLGARVLAWPRVRHALSPAQVAVVRGGVERRLAALIVASRFLPGTRLALYLACGALRTSWGRFAAWCAAAVALWTPLVVLGAAHAVPVIPFSGGLATLVGLLVVFIALGALRALQHRLSDPLQRARLIARISLAWRWEFWPMWLFYAPVAAWMALLLVRYRGVGALRAANPGMPDGGIVGESKFVILQALPPRWTAPSLFAPPGLAADRLERVEEAMRRCGWTFPVIFKPDVGQRGSGVKLVRSSTDAQEYLARHAGAVVVQPYHQGPYEAGVFYYRFPSEPRGRILSITDKRFPAVVGDGASTLEQLIWGDSRLRMQAGTFLSRHAARRDWVPEAGERVPLALAGNHCQGTLFRDGRHLITPALEARIDEIARAYEGFFIGRFDIRYADVEQFMAGAEFTIIELNGTTAESTNIYDPDGSLFAAYRQLFRQWHLVFQIGDRNRAMGSPSMSVVELLRLVRAHQTAPAVFAQSD